MLFLGLGFSAGGGAGGGLSSRSRTSTCAGSSTSAAGLGFAAAFFAGAGLIASAAAGLGSSFGAGAGAPWSAGAACVGWRLLGVRRDTVQAPLPLHGLEDQVEIDPFRRGREESGDPHMPRSLICRRWYSLGWNRRTGDRSRLRFLRLLKTLARRSGLLTR